jgi:YD repeat-containing protein
MGNIPELTTILNSQLSYDGAGNLIQINDSNDSRHEWEYDPTQLLTAETNKQGSSHPPTHLPSRKGADKDGNCNRR